MTESQACWLSLLIGFLVTVGSVTGCAGGSVQPDRPASNVKRYLGVDPGQGPTGVTVNHDQSFITEQEDRDGIPQQQNAGSFSMTPRGFLQINLTEAFGLLQVPPVAGTWGLEITGEAGLLRLSKNGLTNNVQTVMTLLAPAENCPGSSQSGSFQFVTIPIAPAPAWNATTDTAFGSADISINGTAVNFSNVRQFTRAGAPPQNPGPATAVGGCGPAVYGNTISVPADSTAPPPAPSAARLVIGSTGFLLESNGNSAPRSNLLGAGVGAVGVMKPSSPLNTSDVTAAQFGGFITYSPTVIMTLSPIASFGWQGAPTTGLPTGCQSRTSTNLVGGDFIVSGNHDDPLAAIFPNGLGNFNYCIDLGAQDASNNGLYSSVLVTHFLPPSTTFTYDAVAVVGKLQNRYVIFLVGKGRGASGASAAPLGIYLFQDNH